MVCLFDFLLDVAINKTMLAIGICREWILTFSIEQLKTFYFKPAGDLLTSYNVFTTDAPVTDVSGTQEHLCICSHFLVEISN